MPACGHLGQARALAAEGVLHGGHVAVEGLAAFREVIQEPFAHTFTSKFHYPARNAPSKPHCSGSCVNIIANGGTARQMLVPESDSRFDKNGTHFLCISLENLRVLE
jgi:hypothetical protein